MALHDHLSPRADRPSLGTARACSGSRRRSRAAAGRHPSRSARAARRASRCPAASSSGRCARTRAAVSVVVDGRRTGCDDDGDGFFCAVLPCRSTRGARRTRCWWRTRAASQEIEDPYRFLPALGELDLHLIREGRHEELWKALGAEPMTHQGVDRHPLHRVGAERPRGPGRRGLHLLGRHRPTRCARSAPPGCGSCSCRASARASGTSSRSRARTAAASCKADPMARRTEVPPATASVVHRLALRVGRRGVAGAPRRHVPVHEAPFSVYEVHLPSWRPGLTYRQLAERAPRVRRRPRLHPCRADAGRRASLRRAPGATRSPASTPRPPGWAPRTTSSTWSTRCTGPVSAC